MGQVVNKAQLSQIIGKSERTLTEWQKERGFPIKRDSARGASNQYDTADVIEWMIQRALGGQEKESSYDRLNRLRADREELAFARDVGDLVPAKEIEQLLLQVTTAIRTNMLGANSKLKHELDTLYDTNIDISLLHEHSRDILTHLSELGDQYAPGGEPGAAGVPAAAADVIDGVGEQIPVDCE